jgi:hypothetical protein
MRAKGSNMRRPIGITILAVLSYFVGACYLIAAIGFLSSGRREFETSIPGGLSPQFGWLFLLIAIVDLVAGYGLWRLRRWGWGLFVALIMINIGIAIGALFAPFTIIAPIISLAVSGFILWYLFRPGVKAAFLGPDNSRPEIGRVA